ncbi:D-aminoacyl-tRNA deacylase [Tomitella fengzijianii]|uniref:D-aminoacyl-tRNA deacylase n=1 Tax=Tomitella fengzijianii TaxID=2597660 RepID=A0A516X0P5_9ACTN|nr:D-aminoacyl-tRNA deacylase [Tomitella fengzijianii]QDQ96638.1 D-tyrosyl-tRNA(Tyr) deacylase [Tomitella fengzijianii]
MRAVVQRVTWARVQVDGETVGEILGDSGPGRADTDAPGARQGLLVLVGATHSDDVAAAAALAAKIWRLRILDGETSASDLDAPVLVVSQFTLYGDACKGRRPSWNQAAPGSVAEPLVDALTGELRRLGARVQSGSFGAHMQVASTNDGPVTILLDA